MCEFMETEDQLIPYDIIQEAMSDNINPFFTEVLDDSIKPFFEDSA